MKNLLLILFILNFMPSAKAQYSPVIFEGSYGRFLTEDGLKFYDAKTIVSTSVDPTSVATPGDPGSLFLGDTGILYIKQDSGSSTDWEAIPFTSDLTDYAYLPGRAGGQILTGGTASGDDLTLRSTSNVTKGSIIIDETTASSSSSTGALIIGGGLGIGEDIYTTGTVNVGSTTPSTSATTGALIVGGGIGLGAGVYSTGTITATNQITAQRDDQLTQVISQVASDTASTAPTFTLRRDRGTIASPTALQSGDIIGDLSARGWDTAESIGGYIRFEADAEWGTSSDDSDNPTRILFGTAPDGSETVAEAMRITSASRVGIGNTAPSTVLHVNGRVTLDQTTAPSTPSSDDNAIYALSDDKLYMLDDGGTEHLIGGLTTVSGNVSSNTNWSTVAAAGTTGDITSFSLTPGRWLISTMLTIENNAIITGTELIFGVSTTTGNSLTGVTLGLNRADMQPMPTGGADSYNLHIVNYPVTVASTTTYYLKGRILTSISQVFYTYSYYARRVD